MTTGKGVPWEAFFRLAEREPREREDELSRLAKTDPDRAGGLRTLLRAHDAQQTVLDRPLFDGPDAISRAADFPQLPFAELGPFELIEPIGAGGMAEVYLAHRRDSQQRVAIKILRPDRGTSSIEERLAREIEVLARIEHPNIARLIDHGRSIDGRTWVAMEYVDGLPIDLACRESALNLSQRLRLFVEVCQAVHAAHSNLIVHRDIKPSNILLDDRPRLLDFGIAKDLEQQDHTETAERRLTVSHASPEQLRGEDVTTATDIYSLGVLLCQLLTDRLPYRSTVLGPGNVGALASDILAGRRMRPSDVARQATFEDEAPPPPISSSQLRGDLDAIVLRATAFEAERRYASCADLADDVQRHLDRRPISAQRDSFGYLAGKFVRRHPVAVSLVVATGLLLCAAVVGLTFQTRNLGRALERASSQAERADLNNQLLLSLLNEASPILSQGQEVSLREALDRGSERLLSRIADSPLDELRLRAILISTLIALDRHDDARQQLTLADELLDRLPTGDGGPASIATAERRVLSGQLATHRSNLAQLEGRHEEAQRIASEALARLDAQIPGQPVWSWDEDHLRARLLAALARAQSARGTLDLALNSSKRAAEAVARVLRASPEHGLALRTGVRVHSDYGRTLASLDRFDEALAAQQEALDLSLTRFGAVDADTLRARFERSLTLERSGRLQQARSQYLQTLEGWRDLVGEAHPLWQRTAGRLAAVHQRLDEFVEAGRLYETLLAAPSADPLLHSTRALNFGWLQHEQGDFAAAEALYERAHDLLLEAQVPEYRLITVLNNRGLLALDRAEFEQSRMLLARSHEIAARLYGERHSVVAFPLTNLARLDSELGHGKQAEERFRDALTIRAAALPANHPDHVHSLLGLARLLCGPEPAFRTSAEEGLRHALRARSLLQATPSTYKTALATLVVCDCQQRVDRDALDRAELEAALEVVTQVRGSDDPLVERGRVSLRSAG